MWTYHIFQTISTSPAQIWEENGGVSYSLNVVYLACCGGGGGGGAGFFFSYFPPLTPRCVLWSGESYSPKNMVVYQLVTGLFWKNNITHGKRRS